MKAPSDVEYATLGAKNSHFALCLHLYRLLSKVTTEAGCNLSIKVRIKGPAKGLLDFNS